MGKAIEDLKKEHDAILHVLNVLDKMKSSVSKKDDEKLHYYSEVVYFLEIFADKCHHGKEENYLFAALAGQGMASDGISIEDLLAEHHQGREYIAEMKTALAGNDIDEFGAAASRYGSLLRAHIDKENNDLFVAADQFLTEDMQYNLFEEFEAYEEHVIGHGVHDELHAMMNRWSVDFAADS